MTKDQYQSLEDSEAMRAGPWASEQVRLSPDAVGQPGLPGRCFQKLRAHSGSHGPRGVLLTGMKVVGEVGARRKRGEVGGEG